MPIFHFLIGSSASPKFSTSTGMGNTNIQFCHLLHQTCNTTQKTRVGVIDYLQYYVIQNRIPNSKLNKIERRKKKSHPKKIVKSAEAMMKALVIGALADFPLFGYRCRRKIQEEKGQTLSLVEFTTVAAKSNYQDPIVLSNDSRQRTAEEHDSDRNKSSGGGDDSSNFMATTTATKI
ncbi:hypothetical protein PIB30_055095 [Stylosanthes scabra]|uniref:Uncharacterized protein n=1 Tax=Stylosanthes scabra TaxID=79078 RepID=A0ABU6SJP0_9FABA|nr:hypothetical protein [Stylosanthes scabra]